MSIKNDGNMIPDTILSPSNFHMEYVSDEDTIYNGTIGKQTIIMEAKKGGIYIGAEVGKSKQVSTTLKQLVADGDVVVFNGAPSTIVVNDEPENGDEIELEVTDIQIEEPEVEKPKKTRKKKDA